MTELFLDYRDPNPPEDEPIGRCDKCHGAIYEGDDVYQDDDEGLLCYECYDELLEKRRDEAHRVAGEIGWNV